MSSLTDTVDSLYQGNDLEDRTEVYRGMTVSFGNYEKYSGSSGGFRSLSTFFTKSTKGPSEVESLPSIRLVPSPTSIKLFSEEGGAPLIRVDRTPHHGMLPNHLQFLEKDYTGRSGNEAYDIFAEILRLNPKIKFPGEK